MTRGWRGVVCASGLALLTGGALGCLPVRVWEVPHLTGRLRREVDPVSGATVTWLTLDRRSPPAILSSASSVTNDRGEFAIPAKRKWGAGAPFPAHALARWRVEVESSGGTTILWQQQLVVPGRQSTPGRVKIDCDLAQADPCVLVDTDEPRLHPTGRRLPMQPR